MRTITLGFACNNACVFCAQGELGRGYRPDGAAVARALEAVVAGETVVLLGGEPTLFADLPLWIRAADARGAARVVVQTNGRRLAYRAFTQALRAASARLALDVSLHGSTAPMHDWHTGTAGSFAQTVRGLRNARAERIPAGVTVVVTRSNYRHLTEIARVAHAAGAVAVHFAAVQPFGRALRDHARVAPAADLTLPHLQRAAAEAHGLGMRAQIGDATGATEDLFGGIGEVEPPAPGDERVVEERP